MEPKQIREGYLVKKGTVLNSWKVVWVVLSEDGVEFYKRKTDANSKGMIPLKGATLTSPCQDYSKRVLVFKLQTSKNQDHFFQATHLEEREAWVKDIKRALSCLEGGQKFARKSTRKSIRLPDTVNLSKLCLQMKDSDDGVKEMKLEKEKRTYNHCFTGGTVVDWLISKDKARNRAEALVLATGLLNEGFLQPAEDVSKQGAVGGAETLFMDETDAFYYFADSGFFCEGNSSDEDGVVKEEFRGNIVKQGCLLKQGHKRKNWKVRKFILRDDPAYLHYYDPTKGDDDPLGSIHLRASIITVVDHVPDGGLLTREVEHHMSPSVPDCGIMRAKRYEVDGNLFEVITSDEKHYYLQAATAEERKEWIKAIHTVSKTGK